MRRAASIALALGAALAAAAPAAAQDEVDRFAEMDIMTGGSGAVVGLIHEGELDFLQAWGTVAQGSADPITVEHVFPFLDIVPSMIAVTARALGAAGALDLDARIGSYLPDVSPAFQDATLEQLLTHRAGLDDARVPSGFDWETILTGLPAAARFLDPGAAESVSRYSYPAVAAILVRVTGLELPDLLGQGLFTPLGMNRSTFDFGRATSLGLPTGYDRTPRIGGEHVVEIPAVVEGLPVLFTSAGDVLQFAAAWSGGLLRGADPLAGRASVPPGEAVFRDGLVIEDFRGTLRARLTNSLPGFGATLWMLPASQTALVGWRNAGALPGLTLGFVQGLVATAVGLPPAEDADEDASDAAPAEPLPPPEEWGGTYRNGDLVVVLRAGATGELVMFAGREDLEVRSLGNGVFQAFLDGQGTSLVFEPAELGGRKVLTLNGRVYVRETEGG